MRASKNTRARLPRVELEYSPEPDKIEDWVREAYQQTDQLMQAANLRGTTG